jgi:(1->4)-alpha-D-glucan 1-alpha-D-glucosylmutase
MVRALDDGGETLMRPPRATYRLQLSRTFGFADAARIAPYLEKLGVSHVYLSPFLRARPGSTHGYDIVAHDELNPELGDEATFRAMSAAFRHHGLGVILDFVPNHMGVGGADNPLWLEVLEWGPESRFAGWFDIDWEPAAGYLAEKVLVPVLGEQYGAALESGKLVLRLDAERGDIAVWAYDTHKLPLCPLHYARVLGDENPQLERLGDDFASLREWRPQMERRAEELKGDLALTLKRDAASRGALDRALARFNAEEGRAALDSLVQQQYWRASHFRVAGDDINYRRFFNINDLAGLRIELPEVFEHAHRLIVRLLREGVLDGLRIDHIDGLLDPAEYLRRVRAVAVDPEGAARPFYLVVEKILAHGEPLAREWPVEGTTGYEFANLALRLLTDPAGESALTQAYVEHTGETAAFAEVVRDSKRRILRNEMASELNVLAREAARVARQNVRTTDFTRNGLRRALRATIASFPVYRTYLAADGELSAADRSYIRQAIDDARARERDADPSEFDFLELLLTGDLVAAPRSGFRRNAALRCAMKFQQLSGPVMAKGLEDTAFYRYNRLISHNEVGGDPQALSATLAEFHAANEQRARLLPQCLLATATHDTKRGEDVRARLALLAEIPQQWSSAVRAWREMLSAESVALGDRNLEYLLFQTLIGSWPMDAMRVDDEYRRRIHATLVKSAREARAHTTWSRPDESFETRLAKLIDAAFASRAFRQSLGELFHVMRDAGMRNSLVQLALKLTVPGVPDIYQGTENWDLSLVDPDNRRAVDFAARSAALDTLLDEWRRSPASAVANAWATRRDGRIKQLTLAVLLGWRREHAELFAAGAYRPCQPVGDDSSIGGFVRTLGDAAICVMFERFPLRSVRRSIELPADVCGEGEWIDLLTRAAAGSIELGGGEGLPFAVLVRVPRSPPGSAPD